MFFLRVLWETVLCISCVCKHNLECWRQLRLEGGVVCSLLLHSIAACNNIFSEVNFFKMYVADAMLLFLWCKAYVVFQTE